MNWSAFGARCAPWVVTAIVAEYLVRDPTPTFGDVVAIFDVVATLPVMLLPTCIPTGLFLFFVRTWPGTIFAGVGFGVAWISFFLRLSAESARSSTAGLLLLDLPFILSAPVLAVFVVEQVTMPRTERS